ncbi:MAG: hypothetical protein JWR69_981 [Pedosphaera sp.]|nr:hypothetical protein [Pedosphaera sp.]
MAGKLTSPTLSFPKDFPEAVRTNMLGVLTRPDFKFLSGDFINSTTRLRYVGDTKALNLFLERLAHCPGVTLSVGFGRDIDEEKEVDWQVSHGALTDAGRLRIEVNPHSSQIKLEELVIPDIKAPVHGG